MVTVAAERPPPEGDVTKVEARPVPGGMELTEATGAELAALTGLEAGLVEMELTDDEVVARVVAGDAGAYRTLVDRHYASCLRYALRMLGDRADAEEAVQDAFARAYRWLARYEARSRFSSWLFQILVNRCRTVGAKQRRLRATFVTYDVAEDFAGVEAAMAGEAAQSDVRLEVQQALARLPERYREALLLKYLDDRTYEDIAGLLGTGVSAVKMRVKRARDLLQDLLKGANDA